MTKFLISQELKNYYGHLADQQMEHAIAVGEAEEAWIEYLQGESIDHWIEMQEAQDEQEQAENDAQLARNEWLVSDEAQIQFYIPSISTNHFPVPNKKETLTVKTLTFGMNIGSIGIVTKEYWEEFKATEITPRFPGYTEREVKGYWEGQPENSIELVIACPDNADNERKLEEIREAYCKRFQQDSVAKTISKDTMEF